MEKKECPICFDNLGRIYRTLQCCHKFHHKCLLKNETYNVKPYKCPFCRQSYENIQLRNIAVKATEERIITLSQDQRTFSWASNGKKLMKVPFEENPYSAFAAFLKTDEGVEVFKSIEKKLK